MRSGGIRIRYMCLFVLLMAGFATEAPVSAEDGAVLQFFGSAIVFPKFIRGSVMIDGSMSPATEISISVGCPFASCPDDQQVRIRAHWVCPGSQSLNTSFICRETGFEFTVPVRGMAVFNPDGAAVSWHIPVPVPIAPCPRGFLIAYVVDDFGQPIRFNALTGVVRLRQVASAFSSLSGIAIPAKSQLNGDDHLLLSDGALVFDGGEGHYAELSSQVRQNFRFAQTTGSPPPGGFATTSITLLTLDVRSNRPNLPTFVPFEFFNQDEQEIGTAVEFLCWTEQRLDAIDPNLTFEEMGTRWGLAFSGQAMKFPLLGVSDKSGPVTLLGLIEVAEGPPATPERTVIFPLSPVHSPTSTSFLP